MCDQVTESEGCSDKSTAKETNSYLRSPQIAGVTLLGPED
jgi:hypothetical protein